MKIWDIIDRISPGVEVTQRTENKVKFAQPGTKFTISVASLILATATSFSMSVPQVRVSVGAQKKAAARASAPQRLRGDSSLPDTQVAMSGRKLANAFASYFEPDEEELDYKGEYFFD